MNPKVDINSIYASILDKCMTKDSIMSFVACLDDVSKTIYEANSTFETVLPKFPFNISNILIDVIVGLNIKKDNMESANVLSQLKKLLLDTPVLNLNLAFYPELEFLSAIYIWVKKNISVCVLNIEVNPEIIGGVIVDFSGRYIDKSLNTLVDNYLVSNKTYVEELLR